MNQSKLKTAAQFCEQNNHRFTKPREAILNILLKAKSPLSAYEILGELALVLPNPKAQTVYRALNFWQQHGFIHSIDSLKSYVACCQKQHIGQAQFLICQKCTDVKELSCPLDLTEIYREAQRIHFEISSSVVEIKGVCAPCMQP